MPNFIWLFILVFAFSDEKMNTLTKTHHTKDGFKNNYPIEEHGFGSFLKWQFSSIGNNQTKKGVDVVRNNSKWLRDNKSEPTLTWINHATFLLQIDGVNILTDPIFSERCSPVQWAGPKRHAETGILLDSLPHIDFIIISHDHYDHLDLGTIEKIQANQKENPPVWYVPLKIKQRFLDWGVQNVKELDWWETEQQSGFDIHCVPAQHFSGRSIHDRNSTLWAGWVLVKDDFRFFFAGDTGYSPDFKEIGEKLGPFDLSCIPIGAYNPRWFMRAVHVDPYEAIQIHKDVKSKLSVGMHWGTFALADENMDEPPILLADGLKNAGLNKDEFIVLKNGEMIKLEKK